jgi:hypothetical protein
METEPSQPATNGNGVATTATTDADFELNTKNELKFRDNLYRMIISQLFYDGYQSIAIGLSGLIQVKAPYRNS